MSEICLILGGARSGKSDFAEELAAELEGEVTYLATAQPKDKEMKKRIEKHKQSRPSKWATIEEPLQVSEALKDIKPNQVVLIDCLTVLVSNWLGALEGVDNKREKVEAEIEQILEKMRTNNLQGVIVSNEVGKGIVPSNQLAREYRDILGRINQLVAKEADKVYVTFAGLPVEIKEKSVDI